MTDCIGRHRRESSLYNLDAKEVKWDLERSVKAKYIVDREGLQRREMNYHGKQRDLIINKS